MSVTAKHDELCRNRMSRNAFLCTCGLTDQQLAAILPAPRAPRPDGCPHCGSTEPPERAQLGDRAWCSDCGSELRVEVIV